MKWIRTYKGYLIKASEIESLGIGRKEEVDRKTGKAYEVFVVRVRTKSGAVYDYKTFVEEGQAKEALEALYEEVRYEDSYQPLNEWLEAISASIGNLKDAVVNATQGVNV